MIDISKICLDLHSSGLEALKALDIGRIVLVLDKDKKLIGTISDGDIRRSILMGNSLEIKVDSIMNRKFISAKKEKRSNVLTLMRKNHINQIPNR